MDMDHGTQEHTDRATSTGLSEDIRGVLSEIERRLDRLRVAHTDRERERAELESRARLVEDQHAELQARMQTLEQLQAEHESAVAAARARFEELDRREALAREAFLNAKARQDQSRDELKALREQLDFERLEFEEERTQARALAEQAAEQLKDLQEDRAAIEATARELDERQKDLDQQAGELAQRLAEFERQRATLEAKSEQLRVQDQKLAERARQTAEEQERLQGDTSDLEQQKQWLAEQTRLADVLRARVAHLEAELEQAQHREPEASNNEAMAGELALTQGKLRDAAGMIAQLREQLDQSRRVVGRTAPDAAMIEHLDRRRRRLAYARSLVREESGKIAKASELLRQRTAALAAHPSQSQANVPTRQVAAKASDRSASYGRLGLGMAAAAGGLAVLAGVSWIAAGELTTPMYAAGVTVSHDARGREVLPEDLAGWQSFHESLLTDPRFYEFAAERMRQRGLLAFGDAVSMRNFVSTSVSWQSGRDGELTLEVRERGADRARRVADTLAVALAGQANSARDRRPDGLPSIVSKEAAAGDRALTNERPVYAGGLMVGLSILSLAFSGLVSSRVARLRERVASEGRTAIDDMGEVREGRIRIG